MASVRYRIIPKMANRPRAKPNSSLTFSSKKRRELQVEEEKRLMKEGIISRKEGFINMPEDEIRQP